MGKDELSKFEDTAAKIAEGLRAALKWSWDERFEAVLAEFPAADGDQIRSLAEPLFGAAWSPDNIKQAPGRVAKICKALGGLRAGQLLLTTNPDDDLMLLGAWWPWGNQKTISLRIIPTATDESSPEFTALTKSLKSRFGL